MSRKPSGRKASFIWNFYDVDSHEKARCLVCQKIYSRKGCCTSGLITHLKKKHTETFLLYLNKGLVRLNESDKANNIKKEPVENIAAIKKRRATIENDDEDDNVTDNQSFTAASSPQTAEEEEEPIEQINLQEDEYPVINIQRKKERDNQPPTNSYTGTSEVETLLTKQLQVQAKLYKEIKEKLDQISTHLRESERISRKRYRLKAEKLRLQKEEMRSKELHRKEMHRLRLLELDILNKKNIQEQLSYDQL